MATSTPAGPQLPRDVLEASLDCVHCGLCLTSCPTYRVTGRETSSPRGRIYLMRGVAEGKLELSGALREEAHLCLGCRSCETACPSGVRYGEMLEQTRSAIAEAGLRDGWAARLERVALREVVAKPGRLRAALSILRVIQNVGLDRLGAGLLAKIPGLEIVEAMSAAAPRVPARDARAALPRFTPAIGEHRGRVAVLEGCVMREVFGDVNRATVRVLARNGFDVVVPETQACCGALHAHAGDLASARALARRNVEAFGGEAFDAVVVNSAGCGAAMRELHHWLPGQADALASKVRDVSEWLDAAGLRAPAGRIDARICYDDPCHLVHAQRVAEAPRRLLAAIPGIELVPHAEPASCCGAAGTYSLTQPAMSRSVLDRKMDALAVADPDVIATGNPGCLLQLRAGVAERGLRADVRHPIELLDQSYAAEPSPTD